MNKEWTILIGLFRATCEQQMMLKGETKQQAKMIFNRWVKEGEKLLKIIEHESSENDLEEVTELIENSIHKLRK